MSTIKQEKALEKMVENGGKWQFSDTIERVFRHDKKPRKT